MTTVTDAVRKRRSVRAFLDKPVPLETLQDILTTAGRSPSGANLQPWQVHVVTGAPLAELVQKAKASLQENPMGEGAEYDVYPPNLWEPYRSRRFKCGEDMYATIGITRDNKFGRLIQFSRNFEFFGAPVGLFFSLDRGFDRGQWAHLGMFMQSVMLLAHERGLATCPQEAWSAVHKTVGTFLNLPENHLLYCGMALGYADPDAPINSLVTDRAPLADYVHFKGF
ncbi:MAG: nitroreductase [Alphaproteobacteria bacterium]|nr:MAG: nitroreductase [Alphaproteobacteria bacterium]